MVETGELRGGAWQAFELVPALSSGQELLIDVNADQTFSLLLVTHERELPHWRKAVGRAMNHPESLP